MQLPAIDQNVCGQWTQVDKDYYNKLHYYLTGFQSDYLKNATEVWNQTLQRMQGGAAEKVTPIGDRRFTSAEWLSSPAAAMTAQMYLLNARTLQRMADSLQGEEKARERVRFAVQQWVDAASPANFLALNPEVRKKAVETRGESLTQGMQLLLGHSLPNVYFHATTAYNILRHHGVAIGKRDFLGNP